MKNRIGAREIQKSVKLRKPCGLLTPWFIYRPRQIIVHYTLALSPAATLSALHCDINVGDGGRAFYDAVGSVKSIPNGN